MTEYFCVFSDYRKLFPVWVLSLHIVKHSWQLRSVCVTRNYHGRQGLISPTITPQPLDCTWSCHDATIFSCQNSQSTPHCMYVSVHHLSFLSLWMTCLSFKMRPCWKGQWGRIGECQKSFFVIYYFSFHFYITTVSIAVQFSYCPAEVVDMTMRLKRRSCFHVWFDIYSKYDILEKERSLI